MHFRHEVLNTSFLKREGNSSIFPTKRFARTGAVVPSGFDSFPGFVECVNATYEEDNRISRVMPCLFSIYILLTVVSACNVSKYVANRTWRIDLGTLLRLKVGKTESDGVHYAAAEFRVGQNAVTAYYCFLWLILPP